MFKLIFIAFTYSLLAQSTVKLTEGPIEISTATSLVPSLPNQSHVGVVGHTSTYNSKVSNPKPGYTAMSFFDGFFFRFGF